MANNYTKGRNLEYSVKERLRGLDYVVFRCAGSRPVDLIAIKQGNILLIERKSGLNPYLPSKQLNRIMDISKNVNATPILVVRKRYRGIRWFKMAEHGLEEMRLKDLGEYCV